MPATETAVGKRVERRVEYNKLKPHQIEKNAHNFWEAVEHDYKNGKFLDKSLRKMNHFIGISRQDLDEVLSMFWLHRSQRNLKNYKKIIPDGFRFDQNTEERKEVMKYLLTCFINEGKGYLRCIQRRNREVSETQLVNYHEPGSATDYDTKWSLDEIAREQEPLPRQMVLEEISDILYKCFDELEPYHREIIQMAYFNKLSHKEMGMFIGIPVGTVKSRLHNAVTQLGKKLKERGVSAELREAFYTH